MSKSSHQGSDQGGFGAGLSASTSSPTPKSTERKSAAPSKPESKAGGDQPRRRRSSEARESGPSNGSNAGAPRRDDANQAVGAGQPRKRVRKSKRREQAAAPNARNEGNGRPERPSAPVHTPRRDAPPQPGPADFSHFELGTKIDRGIEAAGYTSPRPIQAQSIAQILDGQDILGLAQTGTGKTAAFVLPILHHLLTKPALKKGFPRVLIVSPTRELANQIHQEVLALGKFTGVTSMTIFGGVSINNQVRGLRGKPDVLVACPGRLLDLYNQGAAKLDGIEVLVLDEADHMFDMGFLPDVRRILKALPGRRQNLLFSATMPKEIRHLTKEVLNHPHVVELNTNAPVETIEHSLYPVHPTRKGDLLRELIDDDGFKTAIVFTRTKHRAKSLAIKLGRDGHNAIALQGNMSQPQRDRAMKGFKDGTFDILVATDIAARGIDVAGVTHVINYDVPNTPEAYMHRIGRTGRSEREGKAFTFISREDAPQVRAIEKKLGNEIERITLDKFAIGSKDGDDLKRVRTAGSGRRSGGGFGGRPGGGRPGGGGGRPKAAGPSGNRRRSGGGKSRGR